MREHPDLWRMLSEAGLEVLGFASAGELPSPTQVWSAFASSQPETVFSDPDDEQFTRYGDLRDAWLGAARKSGVIDANQEFLISVEGSGGGVPWSHVKLTDRLSVEQLGAYPGHPSFVAIDRTGTQMCGIDTEEHGFWIIVGPARRH